MVADTSCLYVRPMLGVEDCLHLHLHVSQLFYLVCFSTFAWNSSTERRSSLLQSIMYINKELFRGLHLVLVEFKHSHIHVLTYLLLNAQLSFGTVGSNILIEIWRIYYYKRSEILPCSYDINFIFECMWHMTCFVKFYLTSSIICTNMIMEYVCIYFTKISYYSEILCWQNLFSSVLN